MRFWDTTDLFTRYFPAQKWSLAAWQSYAGTISPALAQKVLEDIADYDFEGEVLPVVSKALADRTGWEQACSSFSAVCGKIERRYGQLPEFGALPLKATVILYLGLCSGAGWATELAGDKVVLLGVEKILELGWQDRKSMFALVSHELGHLWHKEAGGAFSQPKSPRQSALFQLYSEGVAMWFEQTLCGDPHFYRRNKDGWFLWCQAHLSQLAGEFWHRLQSGISTQPFFGDWCEYQGWSDTGYFLGSQFVTFLLQSYPPRQMAVLPDMAIEKEFSRFVSSLTGCLTAK